MSKTKPKTARGEMKLFRRHLPMCKLRSKGRSATNCQCPIWCDGRDHGKRVLHAMQTTNWERAERTLARDTDPDAPAVAIAVGTAVADYLADCKARNLAAPCAVMTRRSGISPIGALMSRIPRSAHSPSKHSLAFVPRGAGAMRMNQQNPPRCARSSNPGAPSALSRSNAAG